MKFFLTIVMTGLSISAFSGELESISLITPINYKRPSSFTQTMKSKATVALGEAFSIDIKKKVRAQIAPHAKDLNSYFNRPGELDQFIDSVTSEGIHKYLSYKLTDDGLVAFYGHLGNNLIGKIADKILEKEGVTDPARRNLWVAKLTQPFNQCISTSLNSQYDANHCIEALTASLVPSTGIGLVYELSRSSLNSALPEKDRTPFNQNQAQLYKNCITNTKGQAADVKACALSSMKTGVLKVTDISLSKTINSKASSSASAQNIKKLVWPAFNSCTQAVGDGKGAYTDQFMNCIDNLVAATGSQLVLDKINGTPAIAGAMPAAEVKKLANEKSLQFKKCAEDQKKKGARKDGMLDIDRCENTITNEVTYQVVSQTLRNTASNSFKDDKAVSLKLSQEGPAILNRCWSNDQTATAREACLKKTILQFSESVAGAKLAKAIPEDMPGKQQLTISSIETLNACLDKELPANISESNDLTKRIDTCSNKLTKNVALKVAEYQIRSTASDMLNADQTKKLVDELVLKEFDKCLGTVPTDELIAKCGDALTIKAAKQITAAGFEKEVNEYLKKNGGVYAFGITQSAVNEFVKSLTDKTRVCLDKPVASGKAMDQVNACSKNSIKQIAFFLGDLKFKKAIGDMYKGRDSDRLTVEKTFRKNLEACLDSKASSQFTINDYTKNLYVCSDKVAGSITLDVGQDQIEVTLNNYLKDRPGQSLAPIRDEIRSRLIGKFKGCMASTPADKQSKCTDELKREATQSIVLNFGRAETKAQLNADSTPPELKGIETDLLVCTAKPLTGDELAAHLDECTKNFALGFARELGTLKLNHLLKGALGSEEYSLQKKNIDEVISRYHACLDDLKKYKMNEGITDKLTICTNQLEERGTALVRNSIKNWMSTDQKDAATLMLKTEFAAFIPCLSVLLPSSPYTPAMGKNIESILKPVSVLFAQYIEYNPENAKSTLDGIIAKLSTDLHDVATNAKSRSELVDFLYSNGTLDQFLKSMVQGEVKNAFAKIPEEDVPKELKETLMQKQNFEEMFNSPDGERIKRTVMEKVLKPALVDQISMSSPALTSNINEVKDNVINLLATSPKFGDRILETGVQTQINKMSGVKSFFGKMLYGKDAFEWSKVRTTAEGRAAEDYIREHILLPKFKSKIFSAEENKRINEEAEELVTKAVKSYKK